MSEFKPDWIVPPCETIAEAMKEYGVVSDQFAKLMNMPSKIARLLMQGQVSITPEIAGRLESAIGGTKQFWINRQKQFDGDVARLINEP